MAFKESREFVGIQAAIDKESNAARITDNLRYAFIEGDYAEVQKAIDAESAISQHTDNVLGSWMEKPLLVEEIASRNLLPHKKAVVTLQDVEGYREKLKLLLDKKS